MKLFKRCLLILVILFTFLILDSPHYIRAASVKYGVKIGTEEGCYQFESNLIVLTPDNHIMVKAKEISKKLKLEYKYNTRTKKLRLTNQWGSSLSFTLGSKDYYFTYSDWSGTTKRTASYQFYYDKKYKTYLIPYAALKDVVGCQYYKLPKDDYYAAKGYSGIIFYNSSNTGGLSNRAMLMDNLVDKIIAEVVTKDMTEAETVKALNDYLCENAEYDDTYSNYSAADILIEGTGVCEAYMEAFHILLTKAGITDYKVAGTANNGDTTGGHGWNIVKIGNDYFHVDTTWNDVKGYRYFLLSDKDMSIDHFWNKKSYPQCKKGISENRYNIIALEGDYFYFMNYSIDNSIKLSRTKYDGTESSIVLDLPDVSYANLVYDFYGDCFYYAKMEEYATIYGLNLDTMQSDEVLTGINLKSGNFGVYKEWVYINDGKYTISRINTETKVQQLIYELVPNTTKYVMEFIDYMLVEDRRIKFFITRKIDDQYIRSTYEMNYNDFGIKLIDVDEY